MPQSPDLSGYVDLTLYDKSPQDLYEAAIAELLIRVPDFVPREGAIEVQLMEAIAQQVAEAVYGINRIPGAIMQILLQLYGIDRFAGSEPTAMITFNLSDTLGHVVPAGTRVRLDLDPEEPVIFTTVENAVANTGDATITVQGLGDRFTPDANGTSAGTNLTLIDALFFVDSAVLSTPPTGGQNPEDTLTWLSRGRTALSRLSSTLALPASFTAAALEDTAVFRATTLDNWSAGYAPPLNLAAVPSGTGGTLVHGAVYRYAVAATTAAGETLPCAAVAATIPGGADTGSVVLTWDPPTAVAGVGAITGYKVYRSDAGSTTLGYVASTAAGTHTYTSTGASTPGAAPPIANGTGESAAGYVTVAVYGETGPVSDPDKAALRTLLDSEALANLAVQVVDATVNTVDLTVHVLAAAGWTALAVTADVTAALNELLSTGTWPWDTTVRRNVLISTIGSLESVAYVETLDLPVGDVTLVGVAPLVQVGALSVVVDGAMP